MRKTSWLAFFVLIACALGLVGAIEAPEKARPLLPASIAILLPLPLPAARPVQEVHWLDQNWSRDDSDWFHHASQGTATLPVPYDWFLALEQPGLSLFFAPGLLRDDAYLARIGFIPSARLTSKGAGAGAPSTTLGWREAENPDGLPVGFARTRIPGQPDRIGLTCSACHVGHLDYKGVSLRIDGGPAMLNLNALERAVSLSIFYTLNVPGRFDRFADRVLGSQAPNPQREALRAELNKVFDAIVRAVKTTGALAAARGEGDTPEGFFRLDALNRIGNRLFFEDLGGGAEIAANFHAVDAPVRFPALWTTPWFKWAEYNSSIQQPMVRNIGEALGVGAKVDLAAGPNLFSSSAALDNIVWTEDLLRGSDPFATAKPAFAGLVAPKWPKDLFPGDTAWKIDPARVDKGRALYAEICAACHLGPTHDPVFDAAFPDKAFWSSPAWTRDAGGPTLALTQIPVEQVGTDPAQAQVLKHRTVEPPERFGLDPRRDIGEKWACEAPIPALSGPSQPFALALMNAVEKIARKWMDDHATPPEDRAKVFGARKNCPNAETQAVYRARPLDGIWATAPYLHNGSVASLDLLLRPASERPRAFCLGGRDFDPRLVGFDAGAPCAEGETRLATTDAAGRPIKGNSVAGHAFEDGGIRPGVVGRRLSDSERADLLDYLKTL